MAHLLEKQAAIASEGAGNALGIVRFDDAPVLEAIRMHFSHKNFTKGYPGNWRQMVPALKRDLRSSDAEICNKALFELYDQVSRKIEVHDAELLKLVYRQLYVPDNSSIATIILTQADPAHAGDSIMKLAKSMDAGDFSYKTLLRDFGNTQPNANTIAFLARHLQSAWGNQYSDNGLMSEYAFRGLIGMHEKADSAQRRTIERHLIGSDSVQRMNSFPQMQMMQALANHDPLPEYLPVFEQKLNDSDLRGYALMGYAALKGAAAREAVAAYIKDTTTNLHPALEAIPPAWADDPMAALPQLMKAYARLGDEFPSTQTMEAVWRTGGKPLAEAFAAQFSDAKLRQEILHYFHLLYEPIQADHPLALEAVQIQASGLIASPIPQAVLDSIQVRYRRNGWTDFNFVLLHHLEFLTEAKELLDYHSLTAYNDLVDLHFVHGAHHLLDGLECYSSRARDGKGKKTDLIWLIFRNQAYCLEVPQIRGSVNVDAVRTTLHLVLEDAGIAERFQEVHKSPDGIHHYLFAKPEIADRAAKVLQLDKADW
ncbi:MAG TPA: hypothetical protein VHS96_02235, partial [Bacteroidia bacterium]|nr:hypothetical protein [Bacteroidia bacterium]